MIILLLLAELVVLFFISRSVTQLIYGVFLLIFRHRSVAISLTTVLFFPGTVVHELAHLFTAEVMGVRTGKLSLVPENLEEEEVTAGSVQIAKSDPFRRYAIGFAPLFVGMVAIAALSYWLMMVIVDVTSAVNKGMFFLIAYLLFVISNSMFSSREDLRGFVGFAVAIGLMATAGYIAGIRIGLTPSTVMFINRILDGLVKSTGLVLAVNVILLLTIRVLLEVTGKLLHRKFIIG